MTLNYNRLWFTCFVLAILNTTSLLSAENWPRFRGPTGQGISAETGLPTRWSAEENIAWKTEIPGEGWSSPIVFADRVFLTSTTDEGKSCHVICVDRRSGEILWNTKVFDQVTKHKREENSYATPTPVTDGERVYAVFGSGGIAAVDMDGKPMWTNEEIQFYSQHGLGASPILHENLLIMPYDGSSEGEDSLIGWKKPWDGAVLLALNKQTGEVEWRGMRGQSRLAHVTPNILHEGGETQIVSAAGDVVQGHDPINGKLIWTVYSQGEGVTPSIVLADGLVYSCSGFEEPTIRVVRTGGAGDITATHIAWEQKQGVPALSSLLYVEPYIYAVTDTGILNCFDAKTGEEVWQKRIGGKHSASPIYAAGLIYFLAELDGETIILKAGDEYEEVGRNVLGETCKASIAASQGNLFIRSDKNLFCIGDKPK
jgi:outer membrane protein assembly factor BamB